MLFFFFWNKSKWNIVTFAYSIFKDTKSVEK